MSPIRGISDRVRLPRLGKIRLGIKTQSAGAKSAYPKAVEYFVCPDEVRAVFGDKPKELRIMIPNEDSDQWASHWYKCYSGAKGLLCKGDGHKATVTVDKGTGEMAAGSATKEVIRKETSCNPDECTHYQKKMCRPVMNLQFILPEVPGLGVWQLDTSSFNSIKNIRDSVRLIKDCLGRISMMPLLLKVVPMEVTPVGQAKKKVYVLQLSTAETLYNILKNAAPPGTALLPEPDNEMPDDLFIDEEDIATHVIAENANKGEVVIDKGKEDLPSLFEGNEDLNW